PEVLEKTTGMHRFVWNLAWGASGGPIADEEADFRNPSGPKVTPGTYQVRLTVDGETLNQTLEVVMDPRSPASAEVLAQQFQLGRQLFDETLLARRALAEISSVLKRLADAQQQPAIAQNGRYQSAVMDTQARLHTILSKEENPSRQEQGLQGAYKDLASA